MDSAPIGRGEFEMSTSTLGGRELDIAALLALWIAIHGGDPLPSEIVVDETAVLIAAALDRHLTNTVEGVSREYRPTARLAERLRALGVEVVGKHEKEDLAEAQSCYCFGGEFLHKIGYPESGTLPDHPKPPETTCICF